MRNYQRRKTKESTGAPVTAEEVQDIRAESQSGKGKLLARIHNLVTEAESLVKEALQPAQKFTRGDFEQALQDEDFDRAQEILDTLIKDGQLSHTDPRNMKIQLARGKDRVALREIFDKANDAHSAIRMIRQSLQYQMSVEQRADYIESMRHHLARLDAARKKLATLDPLIVFKSQKIVSRIDQFAEEANNWIKDEEAKDKPGDLKKYAPSMALGADRVSTPRAMNAWEMAGAALLTVVLHQDWKAAGKQWRTALRLAFGMKTQSIGELIDKHEKMAHLKLDLARDVQLAMPGQEIEFTTGAEGVGDAGRVSPIEENGRVVGYRIAVNMHGEDIELTEAILRHELRHLMRQERFDELNRIWRGRLGRIVGRWVARQIDEFETILDETRDAEIGRASLAQAGVSNAAPVSRQAPLAKVGDVQDATLTTDLAPMMPSSRPGWLAAFRANLRRQREVIIAGGREMASAA